MDQRNERNEKEAKMMTTRNLKKKCFGKNIKTNREEKNKDEKLDMAWKEKTEKGYVPNADKRLCS